MSTRKRTFTSQSLEPTGPSRKHPTDGTTAPHQVSRVSKIPSPVRFVLVVLSSLILSSLLFTFASEITEGDLAPVSKHLETWWEVGGLIAWRAVELGLAWILGFDGALLQTLPIDRSMVAIELTWRFSYRTRCRIFHTHHPSSFLFAPLLVLRHPPHNHPHFIHHHALLYDCPLHPSAPGQVRPQPLERTGPIRLQSRYPSGSPDGNLHFGRRVRDLRRRALHQLCNMAAYAPGDALRRPS